MEGPPTDPIARRLVFKVLYPAKMPAPTGPPVPDPTPIYMGGRVMPNGSPTPTFGPAIVTGGVKVGSCWESCTYITPQYVIPGVGRIEEVPS